MTGAARMPAPAFQVARLFAPPAVLLRQLAALGEGGNHSSQDFLVENPALLLRALETTTVELGGQPLALRLASIDLVRVASLVKRTTLQLLLAEHEADPLFTRYYWQLSRTLALCAAALARRSRLVDPENAGLCALLLRCGMAVLEQQHGLAWRKLAEQDWQQNSLLALENEHLHDNHIAAGERLLTGWRLDQFVVDALRYQACPLAEVLDASPLVRICWLANALVEARLQPRDTLLDAGCALLRLPAGSLDPLLAELHTSLVAECGTLDQTVLQPEALTPGHALALRSAVTRQTDQLRQQFEVEFMLTQYGSIDSGSIEALRVVLGRVLPDVGIAPVFLLLQSGNDPAELDIVASAHTATPPEGLALACHAGRSTLADLVLEQDVGALLRDTARSVVDHQVLDLLGGQYVITENVREGARRMVLLLGLNADASTRYMAMGGLRQFLRALLLRALHQTDDDNSVPMLLYRQRVREAVHEASNPLTIIKNYLQILGRKQGDLAQATEELNLIKTEIDRVASILSGLRQPDRGHRHLVELDLNQLITNLNRMFANAFSANRDIRVSLQLAAAPARVIGNENALKQILTNLVKNSAEAIERAGQITIGTRTNVYQQERFHVQLRVTDNGSGIPPALMRRLFIQGTTTKGGSHTGSGLAIVRRLVEDMHGQICCQSDTKGTTITILLPQVM